MKKKGNILKTSEQQLIEWRRENAIISKKLEDETK